MRQKTLAFLSLSFVSIGLLTTGAIWQRLPSSVPVSWNLAGVPTVSATPPGAVAIWLAVLIAAHLLFALGNRFVPRSWNVGQFEGSSRAVLAILVGFISALYVIGILSSVDSAVDRAQFTGAAGMIAVGLLGNLLGRIRRNYWIGIRLPWTLASEKVWIATHRLGSWLFTAYGFIGALAVLSGFHALQVVLGFVVAIVVLVVYSFLLWLQTRNDVEVRA